MTLEPQNRTGLLDPHQLIARHEVRATIPVIEALRASGCSVETIESPDAQVYRVTLGDRVPDGIVAVAANGPPYVTCLRMTDEPAYPGEYPGGWALQADWTPCPACGAPVVWYEAGYVPGYRVCTRPPHHHLLARPS